jgi:hypothetical protein
MGNGDAVDEDTAFLIGFEAVKGTDKSGFSRSRRPHDHHYFLSINGPICPSEDRKGLIVPFLYVFGDDDGFVVSKGCGSPENTTDRPDYIKFSLFL